MKNNFPKFLLLLITFLFLTFFVNTLEAQATGTITIIKNTTGGDGTFSFTILGPYPFSPVGAQVSITTVGGTGQISIPNASTVAPPAGLYSVTEYVPATATLTSSSCTNGTPSQFSVTDGQTTTCTFNNTVIDTPPSSTGTLKIVKNTTGGNGTFSFTNNVLGNLFVIATITTVGGTGQQTISFTPGTYDIAEILPSGWTATTPTCSNEKATGIVNIVAGQTTTCTFNNTYGGGGGNGTLTVIKNTTGGNGTFTFTGNTGITSLTTVNGTALQSAGLPANRTYNIAELVPSGWSLDSATCTNGTPSAVNIVSGQTTTCTFTNKKIVSTNGTLTVIKNTIGGNGTFTFTGNTGITSLTTVSSTISQSISLAAGTGIYNIAETVPTGWTLDSSSCTNGTPSAINIVAGQTTTCTFSNRLTPTPPTFSCNLFNYQSSSNGYYLYPAPYSMAGYSGSGGIAGVYYFLLTGKANAGAGWGGANGSPYTNDSALAAMAVHAGVVSNGQSAIVKVTTLPGRTSYTGSTQNGVTTYSWGSWPSSYKVELFKSCGTFKLVKNTTGGFDGKFSFKGSVFGSYYNNTNVDLTTVKGTAQIIWSEDPGTYNVTETVPSGWNLDSSTCTNGTPSAINIVAGQTTTCTFTDSKPPPPPPPPPPLSPLPSSLSLQPLIQLGPPSHRSSG